MITFLLTLVYAVTALFRVIEIYFNDGMVLHPQVCKFTFYVYDKITFFRINGKDQGIYFQLLLI